jgi:hypothetical protein
VSFVLFVPFVVSPDAPLTTTMRRWLPVVLVLFAVLGMKLLAVWLRDRVPRGTLVAEEPEYTLRLRFGPTSARRRVAEGHGGRVTMLARSYLLEGWSARMRDSQGHTWEVERASGEPARVLEVPPHEETRLPLATPVEPALVIEQSGREVLFHLRLKGAGDETLGAVRVNGEPVPPPTLRLEDAHGHRVARLRFEDTCGGGCVQGWRPPLGLAQPLRAIPEADLGPFRVQPAAFQFCLSP